ncbi:tRNA(fMet)-specific endonuclease VapC [bacterium HR24]|nr:tRNA(fMet)-specific endonuclease VapC [bacterium HR24]
MPAKVVDASVLAAIAFGEPRGGEARALVEGCDLVAPPLLAYELTSVARKKALHYPSERDRILAVLQDALSLDIRWEEVEHPAVLDLALATGLTAYDATYLFLARSLGLPLATLDERLRRHAQGP